MNDVDVPAEAGLPRQDAPTTRHAPPASEGLLAGSAKQVHRDVRRRHAHPGKPGPKSLATTAQLVEAAVTQMDATPAPDIAKTIPGVSTGGEAVRVVIGRAREALGRNAEFYVNAHREAIEAAIVNGDAKSLAVAAGASQWAIQRIAEGDKRIVDPDKMEPAAPALNIGIAIGGVPQSVQAALPSADDVLDAEVDS